MITRKAKKSRSQRGSRTHGWGAGKKHRGAGNRGGRGMAGVGKRGGQKKTKYLALGKGVPIGKHGMQITRLRPGLRTINLYQIEENLGEWLKAEKIKKEKDVYTINLSKMGYDKVLSQGELKHKLEVIASAFSKVAKEKIEAIGGKAIIL